MVSMVPIALADALLPASSVAVAVTVKSPSASAAGTSTVKLPFASTVAVTVCVLPALSVIDSVTLSPAAKSVVPEMVGVVSLFEPSASSEITGGTVSTIPLLSVTDALFPLLSVAVAVTE